jgi:hypothetical protein
MKLKKCNWHGIDHLEVSKRFEGDLEFVNDMILFIDKKPITAAVYHAKNPNLKKGHKEFMCLAVAYSDDLKEKRLFVFGRTRKQLLKDCETLGVWCYLCDEVIYSVHRHHFNECSCKSIYCDGGKDYLRWGVSDPKKAKLVNINLLTDKIKVVKGVKNS